MITRVITLLLLFIGGCSLHKVVSESGRSRPEGIESLFADIRIERWGEQRFVGILALQKKQSQLAFALMDATGLTLLEGVVPSLKGEQPVYKGALQKTELADFLSGAVTRLFLLEPDRTPCSSHYLREFCMEQQREDVTVVYKTMRIGPFTSWRVIAEENEDNSGKRYTYEQPWAGVRIIIGELKR